MILSYSDDTACDTASGVVYRATSETGGQKDAKPERMDQIPPDVLLMLGEMFGFGNGKYPVGEGEPDNWLKGYAWSLSYAALMRHVARFWAGETIDPESGLPHMLHAAWHCMVLTKWAGDDWYERFDDRPGARVARWREEQDG